MEEMETIHDNEVVEMRKEHDNQMLDASDVIATLEAQLYWERLHMHQMSTKRSSLEKKLVELKTSLTNKSRKFKETNTKCDELKDQIAKLEYEVEEQRAEIDELIRAGKVANDKVSDRDEEISRLKNKLNRGEANEENGEVNSHMDRCHSVGTDQTSQGQAAAQPSKPPTLTSVQLNP